MASSRRLLDEIVTPECLRQPRTLRERNSFTRDDGTPLNYTLVNIKDWCKNTFEVVNQLRINTDNSHHRYDVILLINGVPVVQIELKTLGISPRRAMEQIVEYKNDPGNGYTKTLLCFLQLFIVSNRDRHLVFRQQQRPPFRLQCRRALPAGLPVRRRGQQEDHPPGRASPRRFLAKCTLGQMISRYMVLVASEQKLLMMRPYQIYAVKAIVECIHQNCGNGYIWHTTGSGKTLTSFKASTLLKDNRTSTNASSSWTARTSTGRRARSSTDSRKAASRKTPTPPPWSAACSPTTTPTRSSSPPSRSSASRWTKTASATSRRRRTARRPTRNGSNRSATSAWSSSSTSATARSSATTTRPSRSSSRTPSFSASPARPSSRRTPTSQADRGRRRPRFEPPKTSSRKSSTPTPSPTPSRTATSCASTSITTSRKARLLPKPGEPLAKQAVVEAILDKHDAATGERRSSMPCSPPPPSTTPSNTTSCSRRFRPSKQAADPDFEPLNIACVFSPPAEGDPDVQQIQEDLPQEKEDNRSSPRRRRRRSRPSSPTTTSGTAPTTTSASSTSTTRTSRSASRTSSSRTAICLATARKRSTSPSSWTCSSPASTAKFLNTLYVDKNLKHHGLIQAFSRTNRVLNATKPYGNILDFRNQQDAVDAAIAFSPASQPDRAREIWLVDKAPVVIEKFEKAVADLDEFMKSQGLEARPERCQQPEGRRRPRPVHQAVQGGPAPPDPARPVHRPHRRAAAADRAGPPQGQPPRLPRRLSRNRPAPEGAAGQARKGRRAGQRRGRPARFRVRALRLRRHRLRLHHGLIAKYSGQDPKKLKISREQLIGLIQSDAKFLDEREDITEYVRSLKEGEGLDEAAIRAGYEQFKAEKQAKEIEGLAAGPRSDDRVPRGLRRHHPAAHDLRRRAAHRPDGAARPGLA